MADSISRSGADRHGFTDTFLSCEVLGERSRHLHHRASVVAAASLCGRDGHMVVGHGGGHLEARSSASISDDGLRAPQGRSPEARP